MSKDSDDNVNAPLLPCLGKHSWVNEEGASPETDWCAKCKWTRRDLPESRPVSVDELVDPVVEQVDDECPTCGAWMLNPALHADFHRRQREQFEHLDALARRYVSPPRYGGR